jgi:hypothetical protein
MAQSHNPLPSKDFARNLVKRFTKKEGGRGLEGLGWNIQHIWSTDWWHDPAQQAKKLIERLEALKGTRKS